RRPFRSGTALVFFVLLAVLTSARILADSRAFLLWNASGMENVFTHLSTVGVLFALAVMLESGRVRYWYIPVTFAASISRIDSVLPVTVLMVGFVALWWLQYRNW